MKGLRTWERDAGLPALGGDAPLCPPTPGEVGRLIVPALLRDGCDGPQDIALTYARWKPGHSISCGYELRFADGARRALHVKRWRGDRAAALGAHDLAVLGRDWSDDRLLSCAASPARHELAVVSPADRALPGLPKLLDARRLVRRLGEAGLCGAHRPRAHRTEIILLRHRPGRRAVARLEVGLRAPDGSHGRLLLAGRVLPPDVAEGVAAARAACAGQPAGAAALPGPRLLDAEARTGILLEEWLPGDVPAPDDFSHAAAAGAALAALHALPLPPGAARAGAAPPARAPLAAPASPAPPAAPASAAEGLADDALFGAFAELARPAGALRLALDSRAVPAGAMAWTHGDLHPDQCVLGADGRARLLDLDLLGVRAPCTDLASWIADALADDPSASLSAASGALLEAYARAGGTRPGADELLLAVAGGLRARAADALRRLQCGAVGRAGELLARAQRLAEAGA